MRGALTAVFEYLLGFVALALFAYLAFGRGPASDERFIHAFQVAGGVALVEIAVLLRRAVPANRLVIGANLWLALGGGAALAEQWWVLRFYQAHGEASLFASMLCVGLVSTAFSRAGFIGKAGDPKHVLRASWLLIAAVAAAMVPAVYFHGNVKYAAVIPVIALSWLGRLLKVGVPASA